MLARAPMLVFLSRFWSIYKSIINNDIRYLTKDKVDQCKDCEYRYACPDCRPDSLGEDKLAKPWYCLYNPYDGEWNSVEWLIKKHEIHLDEYWYITKKKRELQY